MGLFYKDVETGLYYLNSRYYNPEIGRFINADGLIGETGKLLSHNMYAYCGNNPVMRVDPSGYSWKGVGDIFEDVKDTVIDNVGASVNVGKEKTTSFNYYWLCETETGLGYSKSFDNGKPINFFANAPDNWWQFWEYSVRVDVNVNGKGAGINIGGVDIKVSVKYSPHRIKILIMR